MASRGFVYGVVALLLALLVISSSVALLYYGQYQGQVAMNQNRVSELDAALASYRSLQGSYNLSLGDLRTTLSLLSDAVGNLNTSTPAYINASRDLSSLWSSYQRLASVGGWKAQVYSASVLIDFGNGTRSWYNKTSALPGWDAYVMTVVLLGGNVQAAWYPQYGEHFVTGVDGVEQTSTESWFVWEFGPGGWTAAQTGADAIQVNNGTIIAWALCTYDLNFNPACTP